MAMSLRSGATSATSAPPTSATSKSTNTHDLSQLIKRLRNTSKKVVSHIQCT